MAVAHGPSGPLCRIESQCVSIDAGPRFRFEKGACRLMMWDRASLSAIVQRRGQHSGKFEKIQILGNQKRARATGRMGESENNMKAVKLSSPSGQKKKKRVAPRTSSSLEEDGSPIRHILCVKNKVDVKQFEEVDDCFILDFDPFEPIQLSKLSVSDNFAGHNAPESPDVAVVAEKGQVACRDYPHSRHLCLKFPFETTPHESYCELCYCYVCDSAAPCVLWKLAHCHASEHIGDWKSRRYLRKQQAAAKK
ncbi:PREDICTED: RPM1 interacting [Prunus dulcis]|uniref:PREDICTED: RPM1 interacting n=3 Tax=Prunus dulcis TaxID=3755 RepID=A0A5E4E8S9_PRUDU|nr:PREDICTED: RPM1 interacting [Prunus dulcis]